MNGRADIATRRELLTLAVAAAGVLASGGRPRAQGLAGAIREDDLLRFRARGQVTLLHMADVHAQLMPIHLREPSVNVGVGALHDVAPHITDRNFLARFAIDPGSWRAYTLSSVDQELLARAWGRVGGMDRMATLVKAISTERGRDRVLLLDGGDALQGSYTALQSKGGDMVRVMDALGVEATTGHWEFTLGAERMSELFGGRGRRGIATPAFLAGNIVDTDFEEPVFEAVRYFEKGGVRIAVIGQAFPYTPIANPRWMMPKWSFGIREAEIARNVAQARARGAEVVVLLSHNGIDVDRKLASHVHGIDVILAAHTHDALPVPIEIGQTLIVASGSHGKFLSRLDLEVAAGRVVGWQYGLIPVLSDVIAPEPAMAGLISEIRRPHEGMLRTPLATTDTMLYRRDTFAGPLDDMIAAAVREERDAEIAFSPGFRWGPTVLPGQITWEDVYNATAITYPACYRVTMTGRQIKAILEDVADNIFNPDPYYQQGGDMVRVAGMSYRIEVAAPMGRRIEAMTHLATGTPIEAAHEYTVAGWASVAQGTQGPPIWDVVAAYLRRKSTVALAPRPAPMLPVDEAVRRKF